MANAWNLAITLRNSRVLLFCDNLDYTASVPGNFARHANPPKGEIMATKQATKTTTPARAEGEWSSEPAFFEQKVGDKRTVKACIATSPDGAKFVSIREWRAKADGTPYYTKNAVLLPTSDEGEELRKAFIAALQPANMPKPEAPKAEAPKKAPAKAKAKVAA